MILFDKLGSSRLRPISNVLNASSLSVSIVNSYIKIAIDNLNNIDNFLKKDQNKDLELAAEDLRMATRHLGSIIGKVDVEEILGSIFKDFCIGK